MKREKLFLTNNEIIFIQANLDVMFADLIRDNGSAYLNRRQLKNLQNKINKLYEVQK